LPKAFKSIRHRKSERAAEDLADLFGTDKTPKAVAAAIHDLLDQCRKWHSTYRCECCVDKRDIDIHLTLKNEPFRSAAFQGWSDFLALNRERSETGDERDWRNENEPALRRPLEDLLERRLRDAKWWIRRRDKDQSDLLLELDLGLRLHNTTTAPMKANQLAFAATGYVAIASFLIFLLLATKHVPGADAAFAVFKD